MLISQSLHESQLNLKLVKISFQIFLDSLTQPNPHKKEINPSSSPIKETPFFTFQLYFLNFSINEEWHFTHIQA